MMNLRPSSLSSHLMRALGFQNSNSLMFMSPVILLSRREFLRQEPSGAACLPLRPLSVDCANSRLRAITYYPDRVWVVCINWFKDRHLACQCFNQFKEFVQ